MVPNLKPNLLQPQKEWRRVVPVLIEWRILTTGDPGSLENYCTAIGQIREMEAVLQSQGLCAAADCKQARIAFEKAIGIIREDRRLAPLIEAQDYRNRLTDKRSHSILKAISNDAKTQHGRTPTFTLMDELHSWPKRDLWKALKTGLYCLKLPMIVTGAMRKYGMPSILA